MSRIFYLESQDEIISVGQKSAGSPNGYFWFDDDITRKNLWGFLIRNEGKNIRFVGEGHVDYEKKEVE